MVVGAPPFKEATKESPSFARLYEGGRAFWEGHSKGRSLLKKQLISEELVDLSGRMMDPNI